MKIIGICRFSYIGKGDWKAYRKKENADIEKICMQQAKILFQEDRIEKRLRTLQHLTLSSLKHQTDKDFHFLIIASSLMPEKYKIKLNAICNGTPQVSVHYAPFDLSRDLGQVIESETNAIGFDRKSSMQFRLDDDDCVSMHYIERLREASSSLRKSFTEFAISFPSVLYVKSTDTKTMAYDWFNPFYGVGVATFHPQKGVYGFGHYKIPIRMPSLTIPGQHSLVTHGGTNDTSPQDESPNKIKGMKEISDRDGIIKIIRRDFPFLGPDGLMESGLSELLK